MAWEEGVSLKQAEPADVPVRKSRTRRGHLSGGLGILLLVLYVNCFGAYESAERFPGRLSALYPVLGPKYIFLFLNSPLVHRIHFKTVVVTTRSWFASAALQF